MKVLKKVLGTVHQKAFSLSPQAIILVALVCLAAALTSSHLSPELGRIGIAVLLSVQIGYEFSRDERSFVISPAFLIAGLVFLLFAILPNLIFQFISAVEHLFPRNELVLQTSLRKDVEVQVYFGSQAERFILIFCTVGLAVHGGIRLILGFRIADFQLDISDNKRRAPLVFLISALFAVFFLVQTQTNVFGTAVNRPLHTFFGPIQSLLLLWLLHSANVLKEIGSRQVILLILGTIGVMVLARHGKIPAFIAVSAFIYHIATTRMSFRRIISLIIGFALILVIVIQVVQILRSPHASIINVERQFLRNFSEVIVSKLYARQTETGYCFNKVLGMHADDKFDIAQQAFWLKILVPRAFWAEKPDFSQGAEYAIKYCGLRPQSHHSASISLLGQPVVYGGIDGLLLHGLILFLGLSGITILSFKKPGLSRVVVFALLPWWIDFDQDFALYIGNIIKFVLIMSPFILFLSHKFWRRIGEKSGSPGSH